MKTNTAPWSPAELERLRGGEPLRRIVGRNRTKADVLVYPHEGFAVALKDYSPRPWLVRHTIGRLLARREAAAYGAAGPLDGLPEFLGRAGALALATRWIDAPTLAARPAGTAPPGCFARLQRTVNELHARGVALGDLHHRDVLVDDAGGVWIVDLATAWVLGRRPGRWRRRVFERLVEQDRIAVARLRARHRGEDERRAIERAVGAQGLARYLRVRRWKAAIARRRAPR